MEWKTIDRPGFAGKKRDELRKQYDNTYGKENWRIAWQWGDEAVEKELAWQMYEDGYYKDSYNREYLWKELISKASDVYDHQESDAESGLDYLIQNGKSTHLQDISIRRVLLRRGWKFQGSELIQIRSHASYWGKMLSPGRVPFHEPQMIVVPHLKSWWDENSIEDFYQSNKILQVLDL